jgi:hypothetical protein
MKYCDSCAQAGEIVPATTKSVNPDWEGYDLCEECAREYDSRSPILEADPVYDE